MDADLIPGLAQCVKNWAWLWLWHRPAAAAPVRPLAWELPYAMGVALKKKKKKKRKIHQSAQPHPQPHTLTVRKFTEFADPQTPTLDGLRCSWVRADHHTAGMDYLTGALWNSFYRIMFWEAAINLY